MKKPWLAAELAHEEGTKGGPTPTAKQSFLPKMTVSDAAEEVHSHSFPCCPPQAIASRVERGRPAGKLEGRVVSNHNLMHTIRRHMRILATAETQKARYKPQDGLQGNVANMQHGAKAGMERHGSRQEKVARKICDRQGRRHPARRTFSNSDATSSLHTACVHARLAASGHHEYGVSMEQEHTLTCAREKAAPEPRRMAHDGPRHGRATSTSARGWSAACE